MNSFELDQCKRSMQIIIDTREHENSTNFIKRVKTLTELTGNDPIRKKLQSGDYSCQFRDLDGNLISLENEFFIERKMSAEELSGNIAQHKERFEREFTRAKQEGVKRIYLLVEGTQIGNILHGFYNTHVSTNAYKSALFALIPRYTIIPIFTNKNDTAEIINLICRWELDNFLDPKDATRFKERSNAGKRRTDPKSKTAESVKGNS